MAQSGTTNLVRSIRLSDAEIQPLLDRLDGNEDDPYLGADGGAVYSYRVNNCVIHMQQPGSTTSTAYLCPTRLLSAVGMSFLHGSFVHNKSKCVVQLINVFGSWGNALATVQSCRHVEGPIHEVCIRFDQSIDPAAYCKEATRVTVLLAEDDDATANLAMKQLKALNADVDRAANGEAAVDLAGSKIYDVILMDIEMPVMDGFEAAKRIREAGFNQPIVAVTARSAPEDIQSCLDAGFDRHLAKPYKKEELGKAITCSQEGPLFSTLANDRDLIELIDQFVATLPAKIRALEEAFVKEQMTDLERLARTIKGEGGSYGFEPITDAAKALETAIRAGKPADEIKRDLVNTTNLCRRARSSSTGGD